LTGWLVATALAAAPGGWRLDAGVPVQMVSVRQAVVTAPGGAGVVQTTARAQLVRGSWGVDLQLPVLVHAWAPAMHDTGLGQLRLGVRHWTGTRAHPFALGGEIAVPVPRTLRVSAWGSIGRETLPAAEAVVFFETALSPSAPWTLRASIGWYSGPWAADRGPLLVAEAAAAKVIPVNGAISAVVEAEALVDPTPFSVRALMRVDPGRRSSLDLGVQAPIAAYAEGTATVQIVAQARGFL
jgi:hypothetical protein